MYIHMASLICGGISAAMGEACAVGADIPLLISVETKMFYDLIKNFNVPMSAGLLHAAMHMFSAGITGGRVLKWLNSIASVGGHVAALPTGGAGNAAVTAYLRLSNGALSAMFCEAMGWAFVRDYRNGKMNTKDKAKEFIAFITFQGLIIGFEQYIDLQKPAERLEDSAAKALGLSIAKNASSENAMFIKAAMQFLSTNPMSKAAKGIELVTPAIAAHMVENGGKINSEYAENLIKGSLYSLVCSEIFGDINNGEIFKEKTKKFMGYIMNDEQLSRMIEHSLISAGLKQEGKVILNEKTLNSLESLYNEVTPRVVEIAKTIRGI